MGNMTGHREGLNTARLQFVSQHSDLGFVAKGKEKSGDIIISKERRRIPRADEETLTLVSF